MNINNQNILNAIRYNNLSKNINIENENSLDETLENISKDISNNSINTANLLASDEDLKLLLTSLNKPFTKENINLIEKLIQNGLPANKENLETMLKSIKIFENYPIEKALFLVQNNMKPTLSIGKQLDEYISKDISINKQIENIFNNIENMKANRELLENIFKNTKLDNFIKDNTSLIKDFKDNLSNTILNNIDNISSNKINKFLEKILTLNKNNNLNKDILLKNIIDYLIDENLTLKPDSLKNLKQIFDNKNLNINENKNNFLNSILDKESLDILQKDIFNIIKSDREINLKFKNLLSKTENVQNKIKHFNFKNSSPEDLNDFFNALSTISKNIKNNMTNISESNNDALLKNLDNLTKNLEFMSNVKDSIFLQIPLNINNFSTTADLYVFSDKKHKNTKSKNNSGSALISLNLAYLGKLEAYIVKNNQDIICQFRIENEASKNTIKENVALLEHYLKEKKLILKDISFKDLDESFTLITNNINNINNHRNNNIKISNFNVKA